MKYIDLHCDALTKESVPSVCGDTLRKGDCLLQCFAAFLEGKEERFARALALCDAFSSLCERERFVSIKSARDLCGEGVHALLTVEDGGAIEGDLNNLQTLFDRGVRMMTLTWNVPNEIGYPHSYSSHPKTGERFGLTPFGREAVERMCDLSLLPDVSHGSDELVQDVAEICSRRNVPFLASHAGAREMYPCSRNLSDDSILSIAESGGVVGQYFVPFFLSDDQSAEGQKKALLCHAEHIIRVGGEEALAIGSDFDGAPENAFVRSPADIPRLFEEFCRAFGSHTAEKIFCGNALRVLGALK